MRNSYVSIVRYFSRVVRSVFDDEKELSGGNLTGAKHARNVLKAKRKSGIFREWHDWHNSARTMGCEEGVRGT
jgi:hypothetical protein